MPFLVALLRPGQAGVQEAAAWALQNLACSSFGNKTSVFEAGAVPLLVALLVSEQPGVQSATSGALRSRSDSSRTSRMTSLQRELCLMLIYQPDVQAEVAALLLNLGVDFQHNQDFIVAAGGVPLLVAFSKHPRGFGKACS